MTVLERERLLLPTLRTRPRLAASMRRTVVVAALLDFTVLALAASIAWSLRLVLSVWDFSASTVSLAHLPAAPAVVLLWMTVLVASGAYSVKNLAEGIDEYRVIANASFLAATLTYAACYLADLPLSRGFVLLTFVVGTPLLLFSRYLVRQNVFGRRSSGQLMRRVIAVGAPSGISEVVEALRRRDDAGYRVVGSCVPRGAEKGSLVVPTLGYLEDITDVCREAGADAVLLTRGGFESSRALRRIAWQLEGSGIDLVVVPSLTDVAGPRIKMRPIAGLPLVHVEQPQATQALGAAKRVFDVVGAVLALTLLAPVMLVVAALVWLEDRGPVFFRQPRIGKDGMEFGCYKFRSMFVNAHELEAQMRVSSGRLGPLWKLERDPRITRIGMFIRRYSLDELPQLLNVVRGEMSLVGPRPQQAWEVESYTDWEQRRLRVRPGMTGLWQVSGRSKLPFEEAIRLDLYYVDNWSMTSDLVIMAKTVKAVFGSSGAY